MKMRSALRRWAGVIAGLGLVACSHLVRAEFYIGYGSTVTVTNAATLDSSGTITINGVLDASGSPSGKIRLTQSWNKASSGIFVQGNSTVTFYDVMTSSLTGNTTFHVFQSAQAGKKIQFQSGSTQTVSSVFSFSGTSGNEIHLEPATAGTTWFIRFPNSAQSATYVDVKNSSAMANVVIATDSIDSGGNSRYWIFDGVAPGNISSLSAEIGSSTDSVRLSWIAPGDDGTSYNILNGLYDIRWSTAQISSVSDFNSIAQSPQYQRLISTSATQGSMQSTLITGLQFLTTIYFSIRTRDENTVLNNFSGLSNVPTYQFLIESPLSYQAVYTTTESITWQWTDNSSRETGFKVLSSSGGVLFSSGSLSGTGQTMQWTQTNLVPGSLYESYAVAFDSYSNSGDTTLFSTYSLTNPVTGFLLSSATVSSITLDWFANNNSSAALYVVDRATYPTTTFSQVSIATLTTVLSAGLSEATTYTFRVLARNGNGLDSSTVSLVVMTSSIPPAAITTLSLSIGASEGKVNLHWIAPGNDGTSNDIINGVYDIRWSSNPILSNSDFLSIPSTPSYQRLISTSIVHGMEQGYLLTGLDASASYYFAIRTQDSVVQNYSNVSNSPSEHVQIDLSSPSAVTDLILTAIENNSIQLSWTAPGDDGTTNNNSLGRYDIRYRTDSGFSSLAMFTGASSVFGSYSTETITPQSVQLSESHLLSGLNYDATYYFALRAVDDYANVAPLSNTVTVYIQDFLAPGLVQNVSAYSNPIIGNRIEISWTNPADTDLSGVILQVSTYGYIFSSSTQSQADLFNFVRLSTLSAPATYFMQTSLRPNTTYYYSFFTYDDEVIPNVSGGVFIATLTVSTILPEPAKPTNVRGHRNGSGDAFIITWDSPTARASGAPFEELELSSYSITRLDAPNGAVNGFFIQSASGSTIFVDNNIPKRTVYYKLRSINKGGAESADSDLLVSDGKVLVKMDDSLSYIKVPDNLMDKFRAQNIQISGKRLESEEGGRTFKSIKVEVSDSITGKVQKDYVFDQAVEIAIGYQVDSFGRVFNGAPSAHFSANLPAAGSAETAFSIYWNNGSQWLKLGTSVDKSNNEASVEARHTGGYQLRLVQQSAFQQNGVFPRTITPNNDGINDQVFFFFENSTDAQVQGTLYDMRSAKVAEAKKSDLFAGNSSVLTWDGSSLSGSVVPGGIYIYKIEVGENTYTGTVAVAR